jgi:hypothetical protein
MRRTDDGRPHPRPLSFARKRRALWRGGNGNGDGDEQRPGERSPGLFIRADARVDGGGGHGREVRGARQNTCEKSALPP